MRKAFSFTLFIVLLFSLSLPVSAAAPVLNRYESYYNPTKYNNDYFQYKMNCYGYGSQFYYLGSTSSSNSYKQQPGEFAINNEQFSSLMQSYIYAMTYWNNLYNFVKDRVYEDYASLNWSISESYNSDQAPSGYRKIALVIKQDGYNSDYHFYLQHSDGTWSHKPGSTYIRNTSFDTNEILTNNNISTRGQQGGYDDGIRFFIIGKDAVTDYPHYYGQSSTTTYTVNDFRDIAGDSITQFTAINGNTSAKFDYPGDRDFYKFTPNSSGYYTITTSAGSGYDVDGVVYDSNGILIANDSSTSNANFYVYLNANQSYYIGIWDYKNNVEYYNLYAY